MNITQTNRSTHAVTRPTRLAAICLAISGLVACGDDDEASARSKDAFCTIEKQIDDDFTAAFTPLGDNPTEEQAMAALVEVSKTVIGRVGDDYLSAAPAEVTDEAMLAWAAAGRAASGEAEAFDEPDVIEALGRIDTYCYGPQGS